MAKIGKKRSVLKVQKNKLKIIPNRVLATDIIIYGLNNEKAVRVMEKDNTLSFRCKNEATKTEIKNAFIELYGQQVAKINTANTVKGYKKAYIRLKEDGAAMKVASDANILQ